MICSLIFYIFFFQTRFEEGLKNREGTRGAGKTFSFWTFEGLFRKKHLKMPKNLRFFVKHLA